MRTLFLRGSLLMLASLPAVAHAGLGLSTPLPGEDRFTNLQTQDAMSAGAGVGFGQVGEDYFLTVTPRFDLALGKFALGIQAPLRLRVIDLDPQNDGIIRKEDWDEVQDYFKFVRYFSYGHKGDALYFRIGELAARLGHGTIVDRYMNNIDINSFHLGMQFDLDTDYGGFETLVGNLGNALVASPDSKILGLRAYFKPVAIADPDSMFNIIDIGASVVTDVNAPVELERANGQNVVDGKNNLKVARDSSATVYGFDLDAKVLNNDLIKLTPYTDLNFINKAGFGWHLGFLLNLYLPVGFDLQLPVRLEYRLMRDDYLPTYFSTFYENERYSFPVVPTRLPQVGGSAEARPKFSYVRRAKGTEMINGWYGDLAFDFAGMFQIGGLLEGYSGTDPDLSLFLAVPALDAVKLKAYYERKGVSSASDIFALDGRSMLVAQAAINPYSFIYIVGRWSRQWTLASDGNYEPTDSWDVGVDFAFDI